jgi:hypothetical protein
LVDFPVAIRDNFLELRLIHLNNYFELINTLARVYDSNYNLKNIWNFIFCDKLRREGLVSNILKNLISN